MLSYLFHIDIQEAIALLVIVIVSQFSGLCKQLNGILGDSALWNCAHLHNIYMVWKVSSSIVHSPIFMAGNYSMH